MRDAIEHVPRLVSQINYQLHRTIGENTLEAMVAIQSLMKPKQLHKLIQRRSRDVRSYASWIEDSRSIQPTILGTLVLNSQAQ